MSCNCTVYFIAGIKGVWATVKDEEMSCHCTVFFIAGFKGEWATVQDE